MTADSDSAVETEVSRARKDGMQQQQQQQPHHQEEHQAAPVHEAMPTSSRLYSHEQQPSMSVALLIYWVFPVLLIAMAGRYGVDTSVGTIPLDPSSPAFVAKKKAPPASGAASQQRRQQHEAATRAAQAMSSSSSPIPAPTASSSPSSAPSAEPSAPSIIGTSSLDTSNWPTEYKKVVSEISRRRKRWAHGPPKHSQKSQKQQEATSPQKQQQTTSSSSTTQQDADSDSDSSTIKGASTDRQRLEWQRSIQKLKVEHEQDPHNIFKAISYADAMRFFSLRYHDGGTYEIEAIQMYDTVVNLVVEKRNEAIAAGQATSINKAAAAAGIAQVSLSDEATLDYTEKSWDGMLCAVYTSQGKLYFLANLFARAADAYTHCLDEVDSNYLDARNNRASASIILGRYEQAANDYRIVMERDHHRIFTDAFTGLARILETKEDVLDDGFGWEDVVTLLEGQLIPQFQVQWSSVLSALSSSSSSSSSPEQRAQQEQLQQVVGTALRRFHHVLFTYHDRKTKNYTEAWKHLNKSHTYKLSVLRPWQRGSEQTKVYQIQQVFKPGFWPAGVGSDLRTPIFIVGFPRSGSTLLESVLDAHPQIVGTGENSVFNGRLDDIRNQIVRVSMRGQHDQIGPLTRRLAQEVVDEMQRLWEMRVEREKRSNASSDQQQQQEVEEEEEAPSRFVDKMLTNYFNIGFIHMLYPNALILHVMREPMDTIFSSFKHEFPSGGLEYTSDMYALSELYISYRQVMDHWDEVLPGRVTHIRYEDLVDDMPKMARALIAATGLEWDDAVLNKRQDYHVNTMSATQIRKKVYKDSVKSWMRYKDELKELIELIGDRFDSDIRTTLPN